jgi:HD-GYP domain-containing protein (c-di-GMP phosphodiesterase class II)
VVSSSSRTLFVTAALLIGAPCAALAANDDAPGALKKQTTTEAAVPVQAPAPVATTPQPSTGTTEPQAQAQTEPQVNEKVPVTKGTVKKLAPAAPAETGAATTEAGSDDGAGATTRRRSARRGAATRTATRRARRGATGSAARARRGSSQRGSSNRAERSKPSSPRAVAADIAVAERARRAAQRKRSAAANAARGNAAKAAPEQEVKGFRSITNAADRVVEVIPGTILLTLAGMTALVLLLMIRSYRDERRRRGALEASYGVTVEALATAIEAKDHTTGGHIERVRRLGLLLAGEMVPGEAKDPQMAYGFLLHDIGKLAVPDAILRAPGRLSDEEWVQMRRHPVEGVAMLSHVPFLDRALDVVRHHHERWDGGGYPDGLAGEEIPLWARIFAVVDALDAITADRPYRARASYDAALEEIRAHAGKQFDPAVVDALGRLDPALVEPLLEPAQMSDRMPLEELPQPDVPPKLVAA